MTSYATISAENTGILVCDNASLALECLQMTCLDAHNTNTNTHTLSLSPSLSLSLSLWKVWELTANGVIMVSAIGNDGPLYGWVHIHINSLVVPIKWPSHHLPPFSLSFPPHTINQNPQQPSGHDGRNWSRWNQLWGGNSSFLVSRNDHMGQFKLPPLELPLNPYLDIRTYMVYI